MRELLLGHVMGDHEAFRRDGAELLAQVHQRLGDPAGHIREDEVGHRLVGTPKPSGQRLQQRRRHLRASGQPRLQLVVPEAENHGIGECGRGGGAQAWIEQAQLAEHLAGTEDAQEALATIVGGLTEFHLAVNDDVHVVAGLALDEQHLALGEVGLGQGCAQGGRTLGVESGEQRRLHKGVVHDSSFPGGC